MTVSEGQWRGGRTTRERGHGGMAMKGLMELALQQCGLSKDSERKERTLTAKRGEMMEETNNERG